MDQPAQITTEPTPPPVVINLQPPAPSRNPSKIPLILLGILVVGAVGVGAFVLGKSSSGPKIVVMPTPMLNVATPTLEVLATPNPDPTAGWKTYTNTKYGFSIRYPSSWKLGESKEDSFPLLQSDFSFKALGQLAEEHTVYYTVNIGREELPASKSLSQSLQERAGYSINLKNRKINSYEVFETDELPSMDGYFYAAIKKDSQFYITLTFSPYSRPSFENQEKAFAVYNQILSTFKFLD